MVSGARGAGAAAAQRAELGEGPGAAPARARPAGPPRQDG